jgi:hypothetical protein
MRESDFHWLVGIVEGEGTFTLPRDAPRRSAALRVTMTDADVLQRVAGLFGRAMLELGRREDRFKDDYATTIKGAPAVQLMNEMRPFLSPTRQRQIQRVLEAWRPRRRPQERWRRDPVTVDVSRCDRDCDEAWLAGLLEGEGSFGILRSDGNAYPAIKLEMSDADVVRRAADLLGAPSLQTRAPRKAHWRTTYVAAITGERAAVWMRSLAPLMGDRRSRSIARALTEYRPIRLTTAPARCVVPGCDEPHRSRGLCHRHYMSWSRDRARGREPRVSGLR